MDTLIERKKRFTPRRIYGGAGVLFILVFVFYFIFRDTGSSMTIDKSRITIATVTENEFNDYVRVIGQVLPSRMIYLDAIEGGRVEERLHEEGAMVKKGDVILRLSNPLLNIGIMQSEDELEKFKEAARLEAYASYSEFVRRTALIEATRIIKENNEGENTYEHN